MPETGPEMRLRVAINASFWSQETTGSGQYLHYLLEAMLRLDDAPELVLCGAAALRGQRSLPPGVPWQDVPASPLSRLSNNLDKVWSEQAAFPRAARACGATVAHVPFFGSAYVPGLPTVVTVHDLIPLVLPAYRSSALVRLYMCLVSAAARRAKLVLTDAEAARQDIIRYLHLPPERVRTVLLAAAPMYHPVTDGATLTAVRARHGLADRYMLYLGGFDERRNLGVLFKALAEARRQNPDLPELALAGGLPKSDTAFAPDPRRLAAEAGLIEGVRFLGRVPEEDKPALYSGAETFLFPSRYEGFGLTLLEAIACGAPAIAADATTLPQVGGAGALLVAPDDVAGWCRAILQLAGDAEARRRLRAAGLAHAATFSWENTARQTLDAYREVAS